MLEKLKEKLAEKANQVTELILTDDKTRVYRINACFTCEHFNSRFNTCKLCGCHMPTKTKIKSSKCPINKW